MRKYSRETIDFMNLFERITNAKVKDCFLNEEICFVVPSGQLRRAVGAGGVNVKRIGKALSKRIRIVEFNQDPCRFLANLIYPIKAREIKINEGRVLITAEDVQQKGKIFGREKQNLKKIKGIMEKYFDLIIVVE